MANPEISNVQSNWVNGALRFQDYQRNDLFVIGATTGIPFGGQYQGSLNITAAYSMVASSAGLVVYCTTDAIVVTLPSGTATTVGDCYTLMNTASDGAALLQLRTNATTDYILGGGMASATSNCVLKNTKATQRKGDFVKVQSGFAAKWSIVDMAGTWAVAATT